MAAFERELAFAHELADHADAVTLPAFRGDVAVEVKDDGTPVTAADRDAEEAMRSAIGQRFPDHAVLGEEHGLVGPEDAPTWILDPVDGTKNFVGGIPIWGTLVALRVDGENVVGVASAPALGARWDGVSGGPARRDGRPVQVSTTARLERASVSFGGLHYFTRRSWPEFVGRLSDHTARQRGFGDFWQHCLVAEGAIDLAAEAEVNLWDLAAVQVIVEAAGGRFTTLTGQRTAEGGTALSSNGRLHDATLALLAAST